MNERIADLWNGRVPLARAFWEYAIVYGTLLNLVATSAALAAFTLDWPAAVALSIYFFPLPYNFLMVFAVWRSALRYPGPAHWAGLARAAIIAWAAVVTLA